MKVIVYEDSKWINLVPLSLIKCVFELRCGFFSMIDRLLPCLPESEKGLWVRDYMAPLAGKKYGMPVNDTSFFLDDLLIVNGRWLKTDGEIISPREEKAVKSGQEMLYAFIKKETVRRFWQGNFDEFLMSISGNVKPEEASGTILEYPWQIIHHNPKAIETDFLQAGKNGTGGGFSEKAAVTGDETKVFIAEKARVHPFAVIDTQAGPVYVEKGAEIFPFARVEGPCYIGSNTHIMPGANIREGCSFGEVCKVGGEVEESIFHSYANKYHDGFIGHSYIGEFVNLGAMTTNSDLKNDYTNVTVHVNGKPVDTQDMKVGCFIGDHTKTSIGTLFNTGTSAGIMCNITAGNVLPKYFPSFSWYINGSYMKGFGLEMMLATAKTAMARRKRTLSAEEESAVRHVYEMTSSERREFIRKSRMRK